MVLGAFFLVFKMIDDSCEGKEQGVFSDFDSKYFRKYSPKFFQIKLISFWDLSRMECFNFFYLFVSQSLFK